MSILGKLARSAANVRRWAKLDRFATIPRFFCYSEMKKILDNLGGKKPRSSFVSVLLVVVAVVVAVVVVADVNNLSGFLFLLSLS